MDSQKLSGSKFYQILDFAMRLILLNLLTLAFSFPLITFLPSLMAAFEAVKEHANETTSSIFGPFWKAFKRHFWHGVLVEIGIILLGLLLANSAIYFYDHIIEGVTFLVGYYLSLLLMFLIFAVLVHFPLVCIYFHQLLLKDYLKLSALFCFKDIILSIIIIVVAAAFACLVYFYLPLLIIGGITFPAYIIIMISRKRYYQISKKFE